MIIFLNREDNLTVIKYSKVFLKSCSQNLIGLAEQQTQ